MVNASGGALGLTLVISVLLALNGASGAFGAAGRALNIVYGVDESRGFVRRKLTDLGATLVVIVLFAVVLASLFLGGQIADDLLRQDRPRLDRRDDLVLARWPVALVAAMVGLRDRLRPGARHRAAQDPLDHAGRRRRRRAVDRRLDRLLASTSRNFSSYGAAYGAFGAAIVLLLWLYLSANAFLFGAELNAELERSAGPRRGAAATAAAAPATRPPRLAVGELRRVGAQARRGPGRSRTGRGAGPRRPGSAPASSGAAASRSSPSSARRRRCS